MGITREHVRKVLFGDGQDSEDSHKTPGDASSIPEWKRTQMESKARPLIAARLRSTVGTWTEEKQREMWLGLNESWKKRKGKTVSMVCDKGKHDHCIDETCTCDCHPTRV